MVQALCDLPVKDFFTEGMNAAYVAEVLGVPPEGIPQTWVNYTALTALVLPQITAAEWWAAQERDPDIHEVLWAKQRGTHPPTATQQVTPTARLLLKELEGLKLFNGVLHYEVQNVKGKEVLQLVLPKEQQALVL